MRITLDGSDFAKKDLKKTIALLRLMTPEEQNRLQDFLSSPYFNEDERITRLYQRILDSFRNGSKRINGRPLLKLVVGDPAKKSAKTNLRQLLGRLPQLIHSFLRHEEVRTNSALGNRVLTYAVKNRSDANLFESIADSFKETLSKEQISIMQLQDNWWLYHQRYFHQYAVHYSEKGKERLQKAGHYLHDFYRLTSLRYYCEVLNREKILGREEDLIVLKQRVAPLINEDDSLPVFCLYSQLARIMETPGSEEFYSGFKITYKNFANQLAKPDQLVMVKTMFNTCIRRYEAGYPDGPQELVFWAKEGIDKEAFLLEGNISDKVYLNIIIAAGVAEKIEFMNRFINDYKVHLQQKVREPAHQMATVYSYFFQGQLLKALDSLKRHFPRNKPLDHIYMLRVKVIYIVIYLKASISTDSEKLQPLDFVDEFMQHIEAYRKYIERAKFLDSKRRFPYQRFYKVCNQIFQFAYGNPDRQTLVRKNDMLKEMNDQQPLLARFFLQQMIEKLKVR